MWRFAPFCLLSQPTPVVRQPRQGKGQVRVFHRLRSLFAHFADIPLRVNIMVMVGILISSLVEFALHMGLARGGVTPVIDGALDATLVGCFVGLVLWVLLAGIRERRLRVRQHLEHIAELNHEVRNALQIIADSQFDAETERRDMVLRSVRRIDLVLKRVFPLLGG
jgi:hypothetical protein